MVSVNKLEGFDFILNVLLFFDRNYTFVYEDLTLAELSERALELTIWDHDRLASNEFLGGIRFSQGTGKWSDVL